MEQVQDRPPAETGSDKDRQDNAVCQADDWGISLCAWSTLRLRESLRRLDAGRLKHLVRTGPTIEEIPIT